MSSKTPWTVPSSPNGPWSTGKKTSTTPRSSIRPSAVRTRRGDRPTSRGKRIAVPSSTTSGMLSGSKRKSAASSTTRQTPSRVIPIGSTRNRCGSSASSTPAAVTRLTACSDERPPNRTATTGRGSGGFMRAVSLRFVGGLDPRAADRVEEQVEADERRRGVLVDLQGGVERVDDEEVPVRPVSGRRCRSDELVRACVVADGDRALRQQTAVGGAGSRGELRRVRGEVRDRPVPEARARGRVRVEARDGDRLRDLGDPGPRHMRRDVLAAVHAHLPGRLRRGELLALCDVGAGHVEAGEVVELVEGGVHR